MTRGMVWPSKFTIGHFHFARVTMQAKRSSFLRRVVRRPQGARLPADRDHFFSSSEEQLGSYNSPGISSSSSNVPAASRELATLMSEQQSIISALRDLQSSGRSGEELLCSAAFQEVMMRLQKAQADQRILLGGGSQRVGSTEQKLLVRQTQQMMELISTLTTDPGPPPPPTVAMSELFLDGDSGGSSCGGDGSSSGGGGGGGGSGGGDGRGVGAGNPFMGATPPPRQPLPRQAESMPIAQSPPALIDFS